MAKTKKVFIGLTLAGCVIAIGLITASLATDFWLVAEPVLNLNNVTESTGHVNFGLFRGYQQLSYQGARDSDIWVVCDSGFGRCLWSKWPDASDREKELEDLIVTISNDTSVKEYALKYGMFDYGMWVAIIVMACLGIAWGLIAFGFACFNVCGHPIETITGPLGLYIWNGIAALFSLVCVILYTALYFNQLKENILKKEDLAVTWTSKDRAWPGYSFWLVVAATFVYCVNILLIFLGGVSLRLPSYSSSAEKNLDGVMMY